MRLYGYTTIGIGAVLVGLVALISFSSVFAAFIGRTGKYGVSSLVMLGAFTGIVILLNFVSFENNRRIDVTATNQFSLATRTKDLLKELDQPVRATAFYTTDVRQQQDLLVRRAKVEETFREFKARSTKFSYRFIDPDLKPEIARGYGITQFSSELVVVEDLSSTLTSVVRPTDAAYSQLEQNLVTGILVVTGREQKAVYFLAGHGERSPSSAANDGYGAVRQGLERDNYKVLPLVWNPGEESITVPEDAALLVVAGPKGELPEAQSQTLDLYLQGKNPDGSLRRGGGRMIFLAEPDTPASFRAFLAHWGVVVAPGYIRDLDRSVPGQPQTLRLTAINPQLFPDVSQIPPAILNALFEITAPKGFPLEITLMPGAAPLRVVSDGLRLPFPLAATSANSFLINDIARIDPKTDAGDQSDPKGPFFPAVYVQSLGPVGSPPPTAPPGDKEVSTLVVFGDADFLANNFINRGSGADFFLNSANYLLGDVDLVSIRPKALVIREFDLDRNENKFVQFSSWFFLPGLLGLVAAMVWWLRR
jgi:hypothetical protein